MKRFVGLFGIPILAVLFAAILLDVGAPKLLAFALAVVFTLLAHFAIGFFRGIRKQMRIRGSSN